MDILTTLAQRFQMAPAHVGNIVGLLDDGNTVPFIARYRKEMTGAVDDQKLRELSEQLARLRALEARRAQVREVIESQGALTPELASAIASADSLAELEDLYRPFKPKRRTRAQMAREKGLEPLALEILEQRPSSPPPEELALAYVDAEKGVEDVEQALSGAQDIIAEIISDDSEVRKALRELMGRHGIISASGEGLEDTPYRVYADYKEGVASIADHRVLALDRGEKEDKLRVKITMDAAMAEAVCDRAYVKPGSPLTQVVREAARDSLSRLLLPAIEREARSGLTERAHEGALKVFSANLKNLLLAPPVKGKVTLGLDPAYRTGVKYAVVDAIGRVKATGVIYPTPPHNKVQESIDELTELYFTHRVEVIAIGNGTASRETEAFVAEAVSAMPGVSYMIVSEAGASVYSASPTAAKEFPDYDVSLRSAVSIARRMQDPLAELVKIDPKAIGVGQYQHDLSEARLDEALGGVVESCVSSVGVDINTASAELLSHVAGIGPNLAANLVSHREEHGAFTARSQLTKVARLGPKAFQQCAGFLRVAGGSGAGSVLDNTAVHPESYPAAQALLALCGYTLDDVAAGNLTELKPRVEAMGYAQAAGKLGIGVPTLMDIVDELMRPGRDIRDELPPPLLRKDILELKDLKPGMQLKGTVRNVTDFGAFVDIGVHQDGLVHISRLAARFVKHPADVCKVGDVVDVWVIEVDAVRKRIGLSMVRP